MSTRGRKQIIVFSIAVAVLSVGGMSAFEVSGAAAAPPPATATRALPDFASLVEQVGPAVVNVSAVRKPQRGNGSNTPGMPQEGDPLYEFFKRFGVPFEGAPRPSPSMGLGSGFIISPDGYVLTNAHVVEGATDVTVKLTDGREFKAKTVGADRRSDIATLKIEASGLPAVKIGNPAQVRVGDWVAAIGSPFGFENSVTAGIVSAKSRSLPDSTYVPFIQTDVAVNPGNSGGPLFNMKGEVIGINSQIYSRTGGYMGLSFAIPIDVAMNVKEDLVRHGKVTRGRIGVTIQNVDQALAQSFGLKKPVGAIVSSVEKGGPADQAGLKSGDVILEVGGKPVERSNELPSLVASIEPGTKTSVVVWRNGERKTLPVTIGQLDEKVAVAPGPGNQQQSTGRLGLAVRPLTPAERKAAQTEGGLVVENATGPAAQAGIRTGDVILGVNGESVKSVEELREAVSKGGNVFALLVQRNEARIYVPIRTG
ncbi:MAG: DegQ family serine endoprotease [Betaproteobacteria bacterium]